MLKVFKSIIYTLKDHRSAALNTTGQWEAENNSEETIGRSGMVINAQAHFFFIKKTIGKTQ